MPTSRRPPKQLRTPAPADGKNSGLPADSPIGLKLFNDKVHAILVSKCVKCHGGQKTESGFNLTNRDALLKGGDNGAEVVPGKASESPLVKLLRHDEEPYMPKGSGKLPDEEIASIASWIDAGAPYSKPLLAKDAPQGHPNVTAADRQFWSFLPLSNTPPPAVANEAWCRTPIDRFILSRLEEKGLTPNGTADRRRLIRRAYFDLLGLPPSVDEVEAFVNDTAPDAYDRLIDRLLENPHYGERWARHWLDVARFAESHGYEQDYDRKFAYHYRDFVIQALNSDMPYAQFVRWQLAGDEFEPDNPDAWKATGFLAAGTHATQITANQAEKERYDELDDQAATVGTAFLGLTVGCARCHDHKYDPIPTADYYRLISTFTTTVRSDYPIIANGTEYRRQKEQYDRHRGPLVAARDDYERQVVRPRLEQWRRGAVISQTLYWLDAAPAGTRWLADSSVAVWARVADGKYRELWWATAAAGFESRPGPASLRRWSAAKDLPAIRLHTQGPDFYEKTYYLKRGDLNQKLEEAKPGFLQVLMREGGDESLWRKRPRPDRARPYHRRALANWITDVDRGAGQLLARVIVNRLWQHHFGRGIVATPSDFGAQGERPTHPELLDWLARELIRNDWRLKPLHKLMMTSAVYMESPEYDATRAKLDPDNVLFWRRPRQRLEAEIIRDAMLATGGALDETMFGPGSLNEKQRRRSIYFTVKRSKMIPVLTLFDAPDSLQGIGQRSVTTIAPQALWMLNNAVVKSYAQGFASKLSAECKESPANAVQKAYRIALGRPATDEEQADTAAFLAKQTRIVPGGRQNAVEAEDAALTDVCQALLSLNEFIFVE